MGEMGTFCLVWSPLDLGYFYSWYFYSWFGSCGRDRRKDVARIAREGSRASHPGLPVHGLFLVTLQDCWGPG